MVNQILQFSPQRIAARILRPRWVNIALIALLAWLLSQLFWQVMYVPDGVSKDAVLAALPASEEAKVARSQDPTPMRFFGEVVRLAESDKSVKVAAKPEPKTVQKTNLNLTLLGVLIMPEQAVAVIEKAGKAGSYALNEAIQNNVTVDSVYPSYVLIDNNGALEKLAMEEDGAGVFATNQALQASQSLKPGQMAKLKQVKQAAAQNPISIMRYVRMQMVTGNGKVQGVKVWPRQEKAIFKALGFEQGDVIIEVNGVSVAKISQSPARWQKMMQNPQFNVVVERNGQKVPLQVSLN